VHKQAALLVALFTLPPEFTLQVPSATPGQAYDTKTVKNWCGPFAKCKCHAVAQSRLPRPSVSLLLSVSLLSLVFAWQMTMLILQSQD